jgi:hypothetical protein
MQPRVLAQQFAQGFRVVDRGAVPHDDQLAAQMTHQIPEEVIDFLPRDMLRMPPKVESQLLALGARRQPADHRDAITTVVVANDGGLPDGRPGAAHRGNHHEAGFVCKDDVAPNRAAFFYLRPSRALPLLDFPLVALERAALRFLATEAQFMQEPRDVTAVELNPTVLLDQGAHAPGGPQFGAESIGHRSFQQQLHERPTLSIRQGGWPGGNRTFSASSPPPSAVSRQRMTELAAAPSIRPTSLNEKPSSRSRKA